MRNGIKIRRVAIILGILLVMACYGSVLAAERISDPAGLFSLIPPQGWEVSRVHSAKESQVRADLVKHQAFLVVTVRGVPKGITWDSWSTTLLNGLKQNLNNLKFGPYQLCGAEAVAAVGQAKEKTQATVEVVALRKGKVGIVLTMTYPTAMWRSFRPSLVKVLESFRCNPVH